MRADRSRRLPTPMTGAALAPAVRDRSAAGLGRPDGDRYTALVTRTGRPRLIVAEEHGPAAAPHAATVPAAARPPPLAVPRARRRQRDGPRT
ncbi:hypothetical protein GCM10010129_70580 [Streptomyces fumigatiscleroticus]|nr:hypothetical protein GCM10010129_70580 [Streptomyces fumigatiscleroticus]